jgi:ABC-2 type transport system ATP-binding protein
MTLAIEARGLRRTFGRVVAVDGIDLAVPRGSVYGFLGPNGAGKTTTIRLLLGLLRAQAGEIRLLGAPLSRDRGLFARIGALVERPAFYPGLSARDNLRVFAAVGGRRGPAAEARIAAVLDLVGLGAVAGRSVRGFSTGMRQRLGIGLALLSGPELLVLDEPTAGLDPVGVVEVRQLVGQLATEGVTIFLSSHDLSEVEQVCDRLAVIHRGRILAEGPAAVLVRDSGRAVVRFAEAAECTRARAVLEAAGWDVASDTDSTTLVVGPGSAASGTDASEADPRRVARDLARAELYPVELRLERPSLEQVFLDLVADGERGRGA